MRPEALSLEELLDLCAVNGVRSRLPYSQLEAEAVWREVDIVLVIRAYLLNLLRTCDIL